MDMMIDSRIAAISVIVEDPDSVEELNAILHEYASCILGRMGIPYREKDLNVICLAVDAPMDIINALTGRLGRLSGVTVKTATAKGAK